MVKKITYLLITLSLALLASCVSIQPYQKVYLNDEEMELNLREVEYFENNFQSYREGASGANSGKTGGGCGCN